MELELKKFILPLRHTFSISRESYDFQEALIVCLGSGGKTGYGESSSNPYYDITVEGMMSEIEALRDFLSGYAFRTPELLHEALAETGLSNFALCAIDLAAHDLFGKLQGQPLYRLWGTSIAHYPTTNYTIGIDSIDKMIAKMQEKPWPIYKIKLGTDEDVAIVRALREHTDAVFRVDANCAWTAAETISNAKALKELGVEFLEQPLPAGDWSGMEKVVHRSVLPIIADESCIEENDVALCGLHFNGINIKLTKCGGLTPALRMIRQGKSLGLKIMVGCMTESTVGISAIAQLLPQLDYVDMDGAMLLAGDIAEGVQITGEGKVIFPELGGSGIILRE